MENEEGDDGDGDGDEASGNKNPSVVQGPFVCTHVGCGYSSLKEVNLKEHSRDRHRESIDVIFKDGEIAYPILLSKYSTSVPGTKSTIFRPNAVAKMTCFCGLEIASSKCLKNHCKNCISGSLETDQRRETTLSGTRTEVRKSSRVKPGRNVMATNGTTHDQVFIYVPTYVLHNIIETNHFIFFDSVQRNWLLRSVAPSWANGQILPRN